MDNDHKKTCGQCRRKRKRGARLRFYRRKNDERLHQQGNKENTLQPVSLPQHWQKVSDSQHCKIESDCNGLCRVTVCCLEIWRFLESACWWQNDSWNIRSSAFISSFFVHWQGSVIPHQKRRWGCPVSWQSRGKLCHDLPKQRWRHERIWRHNCIHWQLSHHWPQWEAVSVHSEKSGLWCIVWVLWSVPSTLQTLSILQVDTSLISLSSE